MPAGRGLLVDLIDLHLVVRVAEAGSITHGAVRSHLSLPSASARIRALERALGVTVFDRDRRGVTPTPAGLLLVRHARTVLRAVEQLDVVMQDYTDGHGATVRVLANTAATASLVPEAVASFLVEHPSARIDLRERTSRRIVVAVAERRADLGIVASSTDLGRLRTRTLRSDRLVVITSPADPLAQQETVRYADVLDRPFVGLSQASALQEHLEDHAQPMDARPTYRVRLPNIDAVCHAVAAGIGVAVLPRDNIQPAIDSGTVREIALAEPWSERTLELCYLAEEHLTPTARQLRDHLCTSLTTNG